MFGYLVLIEHMYLLIVIGKVIKC